jgi:transcriptional regulator with XRE-family HTH domain
LIAESVHGTIKRKAYYQKGEKKKVILITLKAARNNLRLNLKEAANEFGIHHETLAKYERDSTNVPRTFFNQIESVYGIPIENIFFGKLDDFNKDLLLKNA